MRPETTIEGVLERVAFANAESGWTVAHLTVRGRGQVTVVGNLLGAQPGESLRVTGRWTRNRRFGEQFEAGSVLTVKPSTFVGIERYLSSGMVKGLGPTIARRLVQHFGLDTLDVIDRDPKRLAEVEGIGPVRTKRILEAWGEQREIREVMVFLQSHGISAGHAARIFKRWGRGALQQVRENPYRLAREIWGIGFRTADKIARDLGIPADSPHRAAAGLLHALAEAADRGHVFLPQRELLAAGAELLELPAETLAPALDALVAEEAVVVEPLADGDRAVYPPPLAKAERGVAGRLRALTAQRLLPLQLDVEAALRWFERREKVELAPLQRQAIVAAIRQKVVVVTGGPGTGKTTLIRGVFAILGAKRQRVLLAAPTGRAAKRLSEATGGEAKTIHRLLDFQPKKGGFARDESSPLEVDVLVVDEASMLDVVLAHELLRAVPDRARLVLVGDVDQLPSVGPGRVLEDLIVSGSVEVVRLTEVFRQARRSLIVVNAHRVRAGELPIESEEGQGADFFFIAKSQPEAILATVKQLVAERIPLRFGLDPRADVQVLTPMQRGILGAANLNAELQALLNGEGEAVARGSRLLRVGDRVMQTRNNYDHEVFNGDLGRVAAIDAPGQKLRVDFEGRSVAYDLAQLDELTLAYATSIHKSQGSEYPCVVIPLHTQHYTLLQRNLLYTALTRGRRLVVVVGSRKALALAVRTETTTRRHTLLARRLASGPAAGVSPPEPGSPGSLR